MRTLLIVLHLFSTVSVLASDETCMEIIICTKFMKKGHHNMMIELPNPAGLMGNLMNHTGYMFSVKQSYEHERKYSKW